MFRATRVVRIAVVMIVASLATLACWIFWSDTRSWTLVNRVPISLERGSHYTSSELAVNMSANYSIAVYVEDKLAPERLQCLLGLPLHDQSCDPSKQLRARWVLTDGVQKVSAVSDDWVGFGGVPSGPLGADRVIGKFAGEKGHRYRLEVDVLSDSGILNTTNPTLFVGVQDARLVSDLVISGVIRLFCIAVAAIGALMLIGSWAAQRRSTHSLVEHSLRNSEVQWLAAIIPHEETR